MKASVLKSSIYSLLWITAGCALFYFGLALELSVNFFSWNPGFDWETVLAAAAVIAVEIFIFRLAGTTQTILVHGVSLIVCIALAVIGALFFLEHLNETIECGGGFITHLMNRRTLSPAWYRVMHLTLYLIPLFFWGYCLFRRLTNFERITPAD